MAFEGEKLSFFVQAAACMSVCGCAAYLAFRVRERKKEEEEKLRKMKGTQAQVTLFKARQDEEIKEILKKKIQKIQREKVREAQEARLRNVLDEELREALKEQIEKFREVNTRKEKMATEREAAEAITEKASNTESVQTAATARRWRQLGEMYKTVLKGEEGNL